MRLIRFAAVALLAAALASCSLTPAPHPSPQPTQPAQAADLRAQLDLLLTEHVIIVAKESAAALNSSAAYGAYAALLSTNEAALSLLVRRAVGNTTADAFSRAWRALNADLVDYAIRIAAHDGDKADADTAHLTAATMPAVADQLGDITLGRPQALLEAVTREVTAIRDTINGSANHEYAAMYTSLGNAVSTAMALGDLMADGIVRRFTDRFPGEQKSQEVARRVRLNVFLQERAYLVTMATDAQVNARPGEKTQALHALSTNLDFIAGDVTDVRLRQLLADEVVTIQAYATAGDDRSRQALNESFANRLADVTKVPSSVVANQVGATIKVIDDQRAKNSEDIANDDRAAATATQPIADSL